MGTFRITGPDGSTYDVTAPEGASEQEILSYVQEQAGNGFAAQAAAMSPDERRTAQTQNTPMGDYLRQQAMRPLEGETEEQRFQRLHGSLGKPEVGMVEGVARSAVQGAAFGGGDEVVAGGATLLSKLMGDFPDKSMGEVYDAYLARERDKIGQFRDEHPVIATGSEIAGAVPTAIVPFLNGPRGASLLGRTVSGATTAGVQGGAYGFNAGEGGAGERARAGVYTGVISAPIGGLVAPAGAYLTSRLAKRLATGRAARDVGVSRPAHEVMTRAMNADDSLTGAGAQRIMQNGPDAMVVDAGPNSMALLDLATQRSGPAATLARQATEGRVNAASQTIRNALDDTLGQPRGVRGIAKDVAQGTSAARGDAYRAAYGSPINYADEAGQRIEDVLSRIDDATLERAVREANADMLAAGVRNQQIKVNVGDDGALTLSEMPNVQQLDYIKRALSGIGREEVDQFGRATGAGNRARGLARELRDSISDAAPAYREAVRVGGDKIERDQALDLGYKLLRPSTTRETVAEFVDGMSDAARNELRLGVRSQIDDTLANVKAAMTDANVDAREAAKALKDLSSRASREKMALVLGDDEAARLFGELDRASAAFEMRAAVAQNSKTFARQSLEDVVKGQTDDGVVNALRSGEAINAPKRLVQSLLGRTPADKTRLTDETMSDLVKILTGPRGPEALRTLQALERSNVRIHEIQENVGRLTEMLLRRNAAVTGPTREAMGR